MTLDSYMIGGIRMLHRAFNPDNVVWRFISKMVDLVLLTCMWAICCLPIITVGASTTALYEVVGRLEKDKEGYLTVNFFQSIKENFWQSTRVWLLMLLSMALIGTAGWWYMHISSPVRALCMPVVVILGVILMMMMVYSFPFISRCKLTDSQLLSMAFVMSIKNAGWTLFMLASAVCILAVGLFVAYPVLLIGPGVTAYIHTKILDEVFRLYQFSDERDKG